MEPTPIKPTKKRRHWLIVAFVLVLVSLCSWWYWPRGDARFVGKWTAQTSDAPTPGAVMTFRSNGTSLWTFPAKPRMSLSTLWEVEGAYFRCGLRSVTAANTTVDAIESWAYAHSPIRPLLHEDVWEIVNVSPDCIELTRFQAPLSKPPITMTLRRIPE